MVQYFYLIFSTGIESEKISYLRWKKMGPKIFNFQSFDLYKGKIIPQCSLELDHSKYIYFSYVIFNIFRRYTPHFLHFVWNLSKYSFYLWAWNRGLFIITVLYNKQFAIHFSSVYNLIIIPVNKRHKTWNDRNV